MIQPIPPHRKQKSDSTAVPLRGYLERLTRPNRRSSPEKSLIQIGVAYFRLLTEHGLVVTMFQSRLLLTIALANSCASYWASAFVCHVPKPSAPSRLQPVNTARATWTGRPAVQSASTRTPFAVSFASFIIGVSSVDTCLAIRWKCGNLFHAD